MATVRKVSADGRVTLGKKFAGKEVVVTDNGKNGINVRVTTTRKTRKKPGVVQLPNREYVRPLI